MSITRATDTDDDGSGTVGTVRNNAWLQSIYDTLDGRWSVVTITATGTQNNLSISEADYVIFNNAADLTITGIVAPASPVKPGKPFGFRCTGAGNVFFAHQNASSSAANRLANIATSGNTPCAAGAGTGMYVYDSVSARWVLQTHEQGAYITLAFSAAHYTGNGAQTWTLTAGDRTTLAYRLSGRDLTVIVSLDTTTVGGTPNTDLLLSNAAYGGYTSSPLAAQYTHLGRTVDATTPLQGVAIVGTGGTAIRFLKDTFANWSAATDTTSVAGVIKFEVA